MKITKKQLKKLIKEEAAKVKEGCGDMTTPQEGATPESVAQELAAAGMDLSDENIKQAAIKAGVLDVSPDFVDAVWSAADFQPRSSFGDPHSIGERAMKVTKDQLAQIVKEETVKVLEAYEVTDLIPGGLGSSDADAPPTSKELQMQKISEELQEELFHSILVGTNVVLPTGEKEDLDGWLAIMGNMVVTGGISKEEAIRMARELAIAAQGGMYAASEGFVDEGYLDDLEDEPGGGAYTSPGPPRGGMTFRENRSIKEEEELEDASTGAWEKQHDANKIVWDSIRKLAEHYGALAKRDETGLMSKVVDEYKNHFRAGFRPKNQKPHAIEELEEKFIVAVAKAWALINSE
jgi:hypothetical protein